MNTLAVLSIFLFILAVVMIILGFRDKGQELTPIFCILAACFIFAGYGVAIGSSVVR